MPTLGALGDRFRVGGDRYSRLVEQPPVRDDRLAIAVEAILAGLSALRVVLSEPDARVPMIKPDGTPVTAGDLAVQMAVCAVLARRTPDLIVVGEEGEGSVGGPEGARLLSRAIAAVRSAMGSDAPSDPAKFLASHPIPSGRSWWTVDPIDGTKGFRSGRHYALCLALVEETRATVGVLSCPTLMMGRDPLEIGSDDQPGTIYAALEGGGAWKFAPSAGMHSMPASAVRVIRPRATGTPWRVCDSIEGSSRATRMRKVMDQTGLPWTSVSLDSQCKYALVAEGAADCFMRVPSATRHECVWDHAPGAIVATEAGAAVSDLAGNPLLFAGPALDRNRGTLACDASIAPKVCAGAAIVLEAGDHSGGASSEGRVG